VLAGAPARAATPLEQFLAGLDTWRSDFTQSVVDAKGKEVDAGAGELIVQRPGRFRWDYRPRDADAGAGQLLVADGRNLWFLDRDLEQVTVKPLGRSLSATPMLLLSASLDELHAAFEQKRGARREGLEWVTVVPRAPEAEFSRAGGCSTAMRLARMVVADRSARQTLKFGATRASRRRNCSSSRPPVPTGSARRKMMAAAACAPVVRARRRRRCHVVTSWCR
jgi:outer membrane lipoprotein carrier protein